MYVSTDRAETGTPRVNPPVSEVTVLGSFSIFLKICPECAGEVSVAAERCGCGHVFESTHASHLSPDELVLRDEELYESYLVARVEQAHLAVQDAEFVLAEDPGNLIKIQTAELTREAAASMEANLSAQRGKVEVLRRLVDLARPAPAMVAPPQEIIARPVVPAVPATKDSKRGSATRPASAPSATVSVEPRARPASAMTQPQKEPVAAKPPVPARSPALAVKAVRVLRAIRRAKTREAPAKPVIAPPVEARSVAAAPIAPRLERGSVASSASVPRTPVAAAPSAQPVPVASRPQENTVAPAPTAKTSAPVPQPVPARAIKPSARAPQTTARKETPAQPSDSPSEPVMTSTPPESFRAEQAARAEQALRNKRAEAAEAVERYPSWNCPNCTATVPENSAQCGCGYTYHAGTNDLPTFSPVAGMSAVAGGPQDPDSRRR